MTTVATPPAGGLALADANANLIASAPDLKRKLDIAIRALEEVAGGSQATGRWLDARGTECAEDEPGARWEEFTLEEQNAWIDSVAGMAQDALREIGVEP